MKTWPICEQNNTILIGANFIALALKQQSQVLGLKAQPNRPYLLSWIVRRL